jgi:hypothetical protein
MEKKSITGLTDYALEMLGCDKEKILKAVENCIIAMGELTIAESKVARKHLDSVMEEMYKRSQDTLINTIQPRL